MKDNTCKVQFIRNSINQPIGVIAYEKIGDTVNAAVSSISKKSNDKFSKVIGTNIALGRLAKGKSIFSVQVTNSSDIEIKRAVLQTIIHDSTPLIEDEYGVFYKVEKISSYAKKSVKRMYRELLKPKQ